MDKSELEQLQRVSTVVGGCPKPAILYFHRADVIDGQRYPAWTVETVLDPSGRSHFEWMRSF